MDNVSKAVAEMFLGAATTMVTLPSDRTCEEFIDWLDSKGVDFNTSLHSVTKSNFYGAWASNIVNKDLAYDMVVALHCYGFAGIDHPDCYGNTPLDKARIVGNHKLENFLNSILRTESIEMKNTLKHSIAAARTDSIFNCDDAYTALAEAEAGSEHAKRLQNLIDRNCKRPCSTLPTNVIENLEALLDAFPNFSAVTDYVISSISRELLSPYPVANFNMPIVLLGPAGLGKTTYAIALSEALSIPMKRIDCGVAQDTTALYSGYTASYKSPAPSKLASELINSSVSNPLYLLDEIDKTPKGQNTSDTFGQLLPILERTTNSGIQDEFFNVRFDYSNVLFIATANDISMMSDAMQSRLKIFTIERPTAEQMKQIATNMYSQMLRENANSWGMRFSNKLKPEVLEKFSTMTPRELRSILMDTVSNAARKTLKSRALNSSRKISITTDDLPVIESKRTMNRIGFI